MCSVNPTGILLRNEKFLFKGCLVNFGQVFCIRILAIENGEIA
jgi:hypothetical protein